MNSNIGNLSSNNPHVIDLRCSNRKRSRTDNHNPQRQTIARNVSDDREIILEKQVNQIVTSSQDARKKSRQSFSKSTKISWVKEYQSCPPGTNMRSWLEKKNASDSAKVSYTSFRRWVMNLQMMKQSDLEIFFSVRSKKNFIRPNNEMEKVLVEFLRIRNSRLHAAGKRKSTPCYIRAKAKEFFDEMYGDDSSIDFKASNGWFGRFQDSYKHVLDPESKHNNPGHITSNQETFKENLSSPCSANRVILDKTDIVPDGHSLTREDIEYINDLMNEKSN